MFIIHSDMQIVDKMLAEVWEFPHDKFRDSNAWGFRVCTCVWCVAPTSEYMNIVVIISGFVVVQTVYLTPTLRVLHL